MSYDRVISFRPDTASNWATNNPVLSQGEGAIETDTGYLKLGDGTSTYNNLPYLTPIVDTYDLTSSNQTHTFPKVQMKGQVCDVFWTNGGTYTLSFAVSNSETIGGETASTWKGGGEGHIRVISDGTNWQVVDYRDKLTGTKEIAEKYANGELVIKGWNYLNNTTDRAYAAGQTITLEYAVHDYTKAYVTFHMIGAKSTEPTSKTDVSAIGGVIQFMSSGTLSANNTLKYFMAGLTGSNGTAYSLGVNYWVFEYIIHGTWK